MRFYRMRPTLTYMAENYLEEIDNLHEIIANRCNIALSKDAWIQPHYRCLKESLMRAG